MSNRLYQIITALFVGIIFSQNTLAIQCYGNPAIGIGFTQGTDGEGVHSNFEVVTPHTSGGFSAYYRDNHIEDTTHVDGFSWYGPRLGGWGNVNGIALLENDVTNVSGPVPIIPGSGNLEAMAVIGNDLYHFWRDDATKAWSSGNLIASGVKGQPGFTQSDKPHKNFEVVVALQSGGLAHWWRDNTDPDLPWSQSTTFASGRVYDSVAMIESNFGNGNMEVIARSGETLYEIWREGDLDWSSAREILADGNPIRAKGVHSFVQGNIGTQGNFELIVPLVTGGVAHYSRDNDIKVNQYHPWTKVTDVDSGRQYTSAAVISSSFGANGNLETILRREADGSLVTLFSNDNYTSWNHKANNSGTPVWAGAVFGGEPCCYAPTKGRWEKTIDAQAIGIHLALQPNGKVLMFGFADDNDMGFSEIFDPEEREGDIPTLAGSSGLPHAFCSGHALLGNGDLWVAGGHGDAHLADSYIYESDTGAAGQWIQLDDLGDTPEPPGGPADFDPDGRWYPTLTRLYTGSVLAISGSTKMGRLSDETEVNSSYQIMDTSRNLSTNKSVPNPFNPSESLGSDRSIMMYPFVYQLPQGGIFVHSERTSRILYPYLTPPNDWHSTFLKETAYQYNRNYPGSGSSVMLPLSSSDNYTARIMLFGGGGDVSIEDKSPSEGLVEATPSVEIFDFGKANPNWEFTAPMNHSRVLNNAVILPDGKIFVVGGGTHGTSDLGTDPVMIPEIFDPNDPSVTWDDTWTEMCPMRVARLYHSTAILLPDGRVMTAGRDHAWNPVPYKWPERRVEIFSPPYLESGHPRPVINGVNANVSFDQAFNVTVDANEVPAWNISKAMLIAPGAVTHAYDQSQRAIELDITDRLNQIVALKAPPNGQVAPPGYYMLFLLSDQGVPSISKFIKLQ